MPYAGIDKLDVRVPHPIPFTAAFKPEYDRLRAMSVFKPDKGIYWYHANLAPYGFDIHVFEHSRFNRNNPPHSRISIMKTGRRSFSEILREITAVVELDPLDLAVARLDLACDVPVSTWWLIAHADVPAKQKFTTIGSRHHDHRKPFRIRDAGSGITLYLGGKPDLYRIYDKAAENRFRYRQVLKDVHAGLPPPEFDALYGHKEFDTVTRVEREMHGTGIPDELRTVRDLRDNVVDFKPFADLVIYGNDQPTPDDSQLTASRLLKGYGARYVAEQRGLSPLRKLLNKSGGHARDQLKKVAPFLPKSREGFRIPDLNDIYRADVLKQISGDIEREQDRLAR